MSDVITTPPISDRVIWVNWVRPDLRDILLERWKRYELLKNCAELQDLELKKCKSDIVYWLKNWVWTTDPRNLARSKPTTIPFIPFPKQEEYLRWRSRLIEKGESGIIEKSRDSGISWLNVISQVHAWLFKPGFKGAFGSRKANLVDRLGDPDSIFEKIRIVLRSLPKWMLPKDGYDDHFMKIINKSNGATVTGEAGDNIGRGGRNLLYDVDEAAFLEHPEEIDAALSNNALIVIYTSTPNGMNHFARKRFSGAYAVFTFHWTDDPRKTQAWHDDFVKKFGETIAAQELDIAYDKALDGLIIPSQWVRSAVNFVLKRVGRSRRSAGLDVATTGSAESVFTVMDGSTVLPNIHSWRGADTTVTAMKARELCGQLKVDELHVDGDGIGGETIASLKKMGDLMFDLLPFRGGRSPSTLFWQGEDINSQDKFLNARAEGYWLLRERFRHTFERATGLREWEDDECISIPDHATLIAQLSTPLVLSTADGKIKIESKADMQRRNVASPDFADALMMSNYRVKVENALIHSGVRANAPDRKKISNSKFRI